jgi:hypothetical protein
MNKNSFLTISLIFFVCSQGCEGDTALCLQSASHGTSQAQSRCWWNNSIPWGGRGPFYMQHLAHLAHFLAWGDDVEHPLGPWGQVGGNAWLLTVCVTDRTAWQVVVSLAVIQTAEGGEVLSGWQLWKQAWRVCSLETAEPVPRWGLLEWALTKWLSQTAPRALY